MWRGGMISGSVRRIPGVRDLEPWTIPEQHYDPGVPWHVTGSLIGLDMGWRPWLCSGSQGMLCWARQCWARTIAKLSRARCAL